MLFAVLCASCGERAAQPVEATVVAVRPDAISDTLLFSALFSECTMLPLETVSEAMVGEVSGLLRYGGGYLVRDDQTQSVYFFDGRGRYLNRICRRGKGPGEYIKMDDVAIDPSDSSIVLLSTLPRKLMWYTSDGVFLRESPLSVYAESMAVAGDSVILYANSHSGNEDRFQLYVTDRTGKILSRFLPYDSVKNYPISMTINHSHPFTKTSDGKLLFSMPLDERIFTLAGDSLQEKYRLDFGSYTLPESYLREYIGDRGSELMFALMGEDYAYNLHGVFETPEFLFFNVMVAKRLRRLAYRKSDRTVAVYRDDMVRQYPTIYGWTASEVLGARTAAEILGDANVPAGLKNQLTETSNPVLILYRK